MLPCFLPNFDHELSFPEAAEAVTLQKFITEPGLELSLYPFSQGKLGLIQAIFALTAAIQPRTACAANSESSPIRLGPMAPRWQLRSDEGRHAMRNEEICQGPLRTGE